MAKDSVLKLREQAVKHPEKTPELLDATAGYVSPEAQAALEKKPEFKPGFLEAQAKQFKVPVERVQQIAERIVQEGQSVFEFEKREFGVEEEIRTQFQALFDAEVKRMRKCKWPNCDHELSGVQECLAHWAMHLFTQNRDMRVSHKMWGSIMDLLYPIQEKSVKAALAPEERRRMLMDPRMRERLRR